MRQPHNFPPSALGSDSPRSFRRRLSHPGASESRVGDLHASRLGLSLRGTLLLEGPATSAALCAGDSLTALARPLWCSGKRSRVQRGQSGSPQASLTEPCTTGDTSPLSTAGPATTTSTTLRLTQQYLTATVTLSPQQTARVNLCSHQVSSWPVCPRASGDVVVSRRWLSTQ